MKTAIVIRSWVNDFHFLTYSLRSIQRYCTGFSEVIVVTPRGQIPPTGTVETVFQVDECMEGYMAQQSDKLHADAFSDADYFCYLDSDTIITRPICPDDLIVNGKPRWLYTPYTSINSGDGQTWKEPTAKVLKRPVPNEMMRRHCLVIPRWALYEFRNWMIRNHGMTLERYIATQPGRSFSEFNSLGAYLWFYHHDRVEWQNTDIDLGTPYVLQKFSWGGLSDPIRNELESALA